MVRRVAVHFSTVPVFVNIVDEVCHGNALINADGIAGGTVSWPSMTQPHSELETDVDA